MTTQKEEHYSESQLSSVSRALSKVLRHEPQLIGVTLDAQGWVDVDVLLAAIGRASRSSSAEKRLRTLPSVTREFLDQVVAQNEKKRFSFSEDGRRIRAVQGHSVEVELGHEVLEPPAILFHGTAAATWPVIQREGLTKQSRHAVHLSAESGTAVSVGSRHGRPVVLEVLAAEMHAAGYKFSQADNGVWLVSDVPPKFLRLQQR